MSADPNIMPRPDNPHREIQRLRARVAQLQAMLAQADSMRLLAKQTPSEQDRDRFLSNLMRNIPGFVYRCHNDRDWSMQFISEGVADVIGYTVQQMLTGQATLGASIHPDDEQYVWKQVQSAVKAKRNFQFSYRVIAADGAIKWLWERGSGVYNPDGSLQAIEGFVTDITELKNAEQSLARSHALLRMTLDELDHRVRNNLASIAALLDITADQYTTVPEFRDAVKSRVLGMANVHAMLSRSRGVATSLRELVHAIFPLDLNAEIILHGPDVRLSARQATALGMVVHELVANSLKYGALGDGNGRILVQWTTHEPAGDPQNITLTWREHCSSPITPPTRQGLGTGLIEGIVRNDLRGKAALAYDTNGANHTFHLRIHESDTARTATHNENK